MRSLTYALTREADATSQSLQSKALANRDYHHRTGAGSGAGCTKQRLCQKQKQTDPCQSDINKAVIVKWHVSMSDQINRSGLQSRWDGESRCEAQSVMSNIKCWPTTGLTLQFLNVDVLLVKGPTAWRPSVTSPPRPGLAMGKAEPSSVPYTVFSSPDKSR